MRNHLVACCTLAFSAILVSVFWMGAAVAGEIIGLKKIRLANQSATAYTLPVEIALRKGYFKDEGLLPELIYIRGTDIVVKALMTGDIDYALPLPSIVSAAVKGIPVRVVGVITKSNAHVLVTRPDVTAVSSLKGKIIGVASFGSASDFLTRVALKKHGLDPKEVKIIPIGESSTRLAALVGGSVQGTVLGPPHIYQAEKVGFRFLVEFGKIIDLPMSGFGVRESSISKRPDEIERVLRATAKGIEYVKTQKEDAINILKSWLSLEPPLARASYESVVDLFSDSGFAEDLVLQNAIAAAVFQTKQDKSPPVFTIADMRFARKVRDAMKSQK